MLMLVIYSFNSSKLVRCGPAGQRAGMVNYCAMTRCECGWFKPDNCGMCGDGGGDLGTIAAVVLVRFGKFRGSNGLPL